MAVVDTSGSMSVPMVEDIGTELNFLRRHYRVTVVECDCEIHAIYELKGPLTNVRGRGGTDFRPPFEREILRKIKPDVVVYFTDGCGDAPSRAPRMPVIWCVTPGPYSHRPAPWGYLVDLA
jgi:predicted metal-dependent peptidase